MTKLPLAIAAKLLEMKTTGKPVPASQLTGKFVHQLLEQGILQSRIKGRGKSYVLNAEYLDDFLKNTLNINSLYNFVNTNTPKTQRHQNAIYRGNSKATTTNVAAGFMIKSFQTIRYSIADNKHTLNPQQGVSLFIHDPEKFILPEKTTVVLIENQENFNLIETQKHLFPKGNYCFFSYYFSSIKAFQQWIKTRKNPYIHFGDFDLAGISIYMHTILPHLQAGQGRFFVPENIEILFEKHANKNLYLKQQSKYNLSVENLPKEIRSVYHLIEKYKAGVEQEVLISNDKPE